MLRRGENRGATRAENTYVAFTLRDELAHRCGTLARAPPPSLPVAMETCDRLFLFFFFFSISRFRSVLQGLIEIIIINISCKATHAKHYHLSPLTLHLIHINTTITQKFKVSFGFHAVDLFHFFFFFPQATAWRSLTFSPLFPLRPRTPSAPCDGEQNISDGTYHTVFTARTRALLCDGFF